MKFDLKRPCKHCPFANTPDRITFACQERAEEIEETAYRQGFVCHEHSEYVEDETGENDGYVFAQNGSSQHCFGALAMYVKEGGGNVPWERLSGEEQRRWWSRIDKEAFNTVFDNEEAFIGANL